MARPIPRDPPVMSTDLFLSVSGMYRRIAAQYISTKSSHCGIHHNAPQRSSLAAAQMWTVHLRGEQRFGPVCPFDRIIAGDQCSSRLGESVSRSPPVAAANTGAPILSASRATSPNGSYLLGTRTNDALANRLSTSRARQPAADPTVFGELPMRKLARRSFPRVAVTSGNRELPSSGCALLTRAPFP